MKRVAATIFLLVYFVTSSGATIQLHYCMDKLVGWSLTVKGKSNCSKCGMEKRDHKGCCHDENKTIRLDKDHKASVASYEFLKLQTQVFRSAFSTADYQNIPCPAVSFPKSNAPPVVKNIPVYLSISVFRI